jgi:glycosyltransferase involved in cell wall biosynthesis
LITPPENRVTAITVVRNGERYLADALNSILRQGLAPARILVIDGQSTDGTARIAKSFETVRYIRQDGLGLANARNIGIEEAETEFIAFLDHDDLWLTGKLETQMGRMMGNPALLYTTTWMKFLYEGESRRATAGPPEDAATPSSLVARREAFEETGLFDPAYSIGCDADWFTRARDAGLRSAVVPEVLLQKRLHDTNLSRSGLKNRREMFRIARQSIARRSGSQ